MGMTSTLYGPEQDAQTLDLTKRYDETCFLTAHNAFASKASGWWYRQQNLSITEMLEQGVRGFMLDIYQAKGRKSDEIYLCHGGCSAFFAPQKGFWATLKSLLGIRHYETLASVLVSIREWLGVTRHENEIVTLFFENYVPDELLNSILKKNIPELIFTPQEFKEKNNQWPTLQELINNKKRIICFNEKKGEHKSENHGTTYCFPTFEYIIESKYGSIIPREVCLQRTESADKNNENRSLLLFNYFSTPSVEKDARKNNGYYSIFSALLNCPQYAVPNSGILIPFDKKPNFIALDFVDQGEGLGVVTTINENDSMDLLRGLKKFKTTSTDTPENLPALTRKMSLQFRAYQWAKHLIKRLSVKKPILPATKS
jgi:hypothetical protein